MKESKSDGTYMVYDPGNGHLDAWVVTVVCHRCVVHEWSGIGGLHGADASAMGSRARAPGAGSHVMSAAGRTHLSTAAVSPTGA